MMNDPNRVGATPEITNVSDPGAQPAWDRFVGSGLPSLIESYNLVHALFAFVDSGMAARLASERTTSHDAAIDGFHSRMAEGLLTFLTVRNIVAAVPGGYQLTPRGSALASELAAAQLGFYREAYGPVLDRMSDLLTGKLKYGSDVTRNGEALGRHCSVGFRTFGNASAFEALNGLGAKTVLDLGCGGGWFLIDACRRDPALRGIGLDISADAIEFAKKSVAEAGLSDRIKLVVGDAFRPDEWPPECDAVDAIFSVGTLHEQFRDGEHAVITLLNRYASRAVNSGVKGIVLGEPMLAQELDPQGADFFLAHIFTEQGLPRSRDQWLALFPKTNLECARVVSNPTLGPPFTFYVLKPR